MAKEFITREAGAVLNKQNTTAIKSAFAILTSVLKAAGIDMTTEEDVTADPAEDPPAKKPAPATTSKTTDARTTSAPAKEAQVTRAMEAAGFSWADLANLLQNALNQTRETIPSGDVDSYRPPYRISDIFDDYFIYCVGWSGTEFYRLDYTVKTDGTISLGTPIYVNRKVTYIAPAVSDTVASEAGASCVIEEEFTRLNEALIGANGETLIKLIAPGLGSSGLYSPDVLARDGAAAFPAGTKMYIDHDTAAEEAQRPEGTITRLAAVTTEDARYIADHKAGAGLYASTTVFETFVPRLNEIGTHIGTSIRADGTRAMGDYNGARVPIITRIKPANGINNRVDFVTAPGAGGKIVSLFESMRQRAHVPATDGIGVNTMTDQEILAAINTGIKEGLATVVAPLQTQISRLTEARTLTDATTFAARVLATPKYATLPETTRARVADRASTGAKLTESGALDAVALTAAIEAIAQEEAGYLSAATGRTINIGLGESRTTGVTPADDAASLAAEDAEDAEMFRRWGLSEGAAKIAATGRVSA